MYGEKGCNKDEAYEDGERALVMGGMMKAFIGQTKFSVKYEWDLELIIEMFETYANMCGFTSGQKNVITVMLNGNSLSLLYQKATRDQPYDDAVHLLKTWFSSREKQTRPLRECEGMRLTLPMECYPEASEMTVYRALVGKVLGIHNNLDTCFHGDR